MKLRLLFICLLSLIFLVSCTNQVERESCGQEDSAICEGLPDGTEVQSCDSCNTCICQDDYAICTEIGCP